ncbi:MAG: sialidase family protein, partial [Steroidobacteraceae bacterium]
MSTRVKAALVALLCLQIGVAYAMESTKNRAALGTSVAVDSGGRLWVALSRSDHGVAKILVQGSDDEGKTWRAPVQAVAGEPVAADGENRPKLAFGPKDEMYVTWTSPTSEKFTGDIRFARSLDAGRTWSAPLVVHRDRQLLSHRFESLLVDSSGRIWVAWVDKRDLQAAQNTKREYAGAAIYYAYSDDRGASWQGDFKLADNSCECCRIALTVDTKGRVAALWRHVFPPNERDHAFALLRSVPSGAGSPRNRSADSEDRAAASAISWGAITRVT